MACVGLKWKSRQVSMNHVCFSVVFLVNGVLSRITRNRVMHVMRYLRALTTVLKTKER